MLLQHQSTSEQHKRFIQEKSKEINNILDQPEVDLWKLRGLAITEGGLLNDTIRKKAWPKLSGIHEQFWEDTKPQLPPSFPPIKSCEASDSTPKRSNSSQRPTSDSSNQRVSARKKLPRSQNQDSDSVSSNCSFRDRILASSLDFRQIELDVTRCTWHLLTGTQRTQRMQMETRRNKQVARRIRRKQRRLSNLINLTLVQSYRRNNNNTTKASSSGKHQHHDNTLRYYQGYHDVACICLSTLAGNAPHRMPPPASFPATTNTLPAMAAAAGLDLPAAVLLQVSQAHLRDSMRANFGHLQTTLRLTLLPLMAYFDPDVHEHLAMCEMEPFFSLSWVITWFAHEIRDTELAKRLFDFFLVSHPLMPIYVSVAMVCHPLNRQDVLQTECDFALVHQTLAALPRNSSMVGWKYQPGDGYVSDDEEDLDDDIDIDQHDDTMSSQGSVDTEFLLQEEKRSHFQTSSGELGAEAVSIVSSSMSTFADARVPFQELLETALSYMQRLPPRNLELLARRYYGHGFVDSALAKAPTVLRASPPAWTIAATAKSDRVLQREAAERGRAPAARSSILAVPPPPPSSSSSSSSSTAVEKNSLQAQHLLVFPDRLQNAAAIAAGVAPGDDEERRRNRQKRFFWSGAVAVAVVVVGIVLQWRASRVVATSSATQQRIDAPTIDTSRDVVVGIDMDPPMTASSQNGVVVVAEPREDTVSSVAATTTSLLRAIQGDLVVRELQKVDKVISGLVAFLLSDVVFTKLLRPLKRLQRVSRTLSNGWRRILRPKRPQLPGSRPDTEEEEEEEGQCDWPQPSFSQAMDSTFEDHKQPHDDVCLETEDPMLQEEDDVLLSNDEFTTGDYDFADHHPVLRGFTDLAGHLQRLPLHKLVNFVGGRDLGKMSLEAVHSAIREASMHTLMTGDNSNK